ncbi:semaphorin-5a [Plakobranchus ocellatus]|uniref:Semaphorin-2A n=1 Tax=Plakobranchus ocellatus TaxID=259542 RepID=A0AAV4A0Y6_9GAST|nr:semaphorin-5a [Plakobranchus ocellatus]
MLHTGSLFQHPDLVSLVQLVIDEDREQLLVGGRDTLYRLHLDNLTSLEMAEWRSEQDSINRCAQKNQLPENCHNFIRVLSIIDSDQVLVCGTNAFDPMCTKRDMNLLANVIDTFDGQGICPFSPHYNSTALMTQSGDIYAATVIDPGARDSAISRRKGPSIPLRTLQQNSNWLDDPNFVSAHEIGNYVYFFFRETAVEYINCGKKIFSRVARVCKGDKGGSDFLRQIWTTFHKARLNCSLPGQFPFYFDELQSTYYSEDEELIYAVFTTPPNSMAGSAVCVYNMSALTTAFDGAFKYQESESHAWLRSQEQRLPSRCTKDNNSRRTAIQFQDRFEATKKYQLMDMAVMSREEGPLIMRENERWTHIVVDHVPTKTSIYDVVFLATDDGKVRKMVRIPETEQTCLVEEIKIVENGHPEPVKNMKLSITKGAIFIATPGDVIKVPFQRCYRFITHSQCSNAQDPYCGWDTRAQQCTVAPDGNFASSYWEQDFRGCPVLDYPVDGGWSDWSGWEVCRQVGLDPMIDQCLCRSRTCDNPRPAFNGQTCTGASMEVENCTVVPVDGRWSLWSGWSTCTSNCNGGMQTRKRGCDNPVPMRNGRECVGNNQEWRMCNVHECPELSKLAPWTEWIVTNKTEGGHFLQRFRFMCRANVETSKSIKTSFVKAQSKYCSDHNKFCYKNKELSNTVTSIDTFSAVDRSLKKFCRSRRRLFKKYCTCRTLGIFLVCQRCGTG